MANEQVQQALIQLAEIDSIILTDSRAPKPEYDRFTSLVHQKEGLIEMIQRETGCTPRWTVNGYMLDCGNDSEEHPPQEMIGWLDQIREVGIAPSTTPPAEEYFIQVHINKGPRKRFRCMDAYQAEDDAKRLWDTGNWTRVDINGETRYGA